jgi:hypothetical protein
MSQVLRPGVQHGKHTDARTEMAEMAGIGSDLEQRLGSCPKQQGIEEPLVAQCEGRQLFGYGENHMGVGHRQQTSSLLQEPAITC